MKPLQVSILSIFLLLSHIISAQDSHLHIIDQIHSYVSNHLQEKIYVQTDKESYLVGDTLWFKATVVNAVNHVPAALEKLMYLDLVSSNGMVIYHKGVEVSSGFASGWLPITNEMKAGSYTLTAFTNYMKNFSEEFYFSKQIYISCRNNSNINISRPLELTGDSLQPSELSHIPTNNFENKQDISLDFFPESGDLLEGTLNNIAFSCYNAKGRPLETEGAVYDNNDQFVAPFRTQMNGKGRLSLLVLPNTPYHAIYNCNGRKFTADLPKATSKGAVLYKVSENPVMLNLAIQVSTHHIGKSYQLIGHCRGQVAYLKEGQVTSKEWNSVVRKANFPTGVCCFTLFVDGKPRAERLVFINNNDGLNIQIKTDKQNYNIHEKVTANILVTDAQNNPVTGSFSFVARNMAKTDTSFQTGNIMDYLLLSSDILRKNEFKNLKIGSGKHWGYYVDLIMMTNGWRRFTWRDVLEGKQNKLEHPIEKNLYLETLLTRDNGNAIKKGEEIDFFLNSGQGSFVEHLVTDSAGSFQLTLPFFYGTAGASYKTEEKKFININYKAHISTNLEDKVYDPNIGKANAMPYTLNYSPLTPLYTSHKPYLPSIANTTERTDSYFFDESFRIKIEEVAITTSYYNKRDSIAGIYGNPDVVLETRQIENIIKEKPWAGTIWDYLRDKIPDLYLEYSLKTPESDSGVPTYYLKTQIEGNSDARLVIMVDNHLLKSIYGGCSIYMDAETNEMQLLASLNPYDIESINFNTKPNRHLEVYHYTPFGLEECGSWVDHALLYIMTKSGNGLYNKSKNIKMSSFPLEGLMPYREFYAPNYKKDSMGLKADQPPILYWQPMVISDSLGKAQVNFYTNHTTGPISMEVQGLSVGGKAGQSSILINPNKNIETKNPIEEQTLDTDSIQNQIVQLGYRTGVITDALTGRPLYNAQVFVTEPSFFNVCTNAQGEFIIASEKIPKNGMFRVACPGYLDFTFASYELSNKEVLHINLERYPIIKSTFNDKLEKIVRKAILNTSKQSWGNDNFSGFYREDVSINGSCYGIYESAFDLSVFHTNNKSLSFKYGTSKFRNLEDRYGHPLVVLKPNHKDEFYPMQNDIRTHPPYFWNNERLQYYDFTFEGEIEFMSKVCYVINFDQKDGVNFALEKGTVFISKNDPVLLHLRWSYSSKGSQFLSYVKYIQSMPNNMDVAYDTCYHEANYGFVGERLVLFSTLELTNLVSQKYGNQSFRRHMVVNQFSEVNDIGIRPSVYETFIEKGKAVNSERKAVKYNLDNWKGLGPIKPDDFIYRDVRYLHDVTINK